MGDPVAASHPGNLEITYSLSEADSALFTIDAGTGQTRIAQGVSLVSGRTYTVTVTATVDTDTEATIDVTIVVVFNRYDLNRNGLFDKDEVMAAIDDYLFGDGLLTKEQVLEITDAYLFGQS